MMHTIRAAIISLHSFRNLVSFRPVTPEFTTLNCVQQASIGTRVSLTAFDWEAALLGTAAISTRFCFTAIR